jgi:hypothetical protein
VNVEFLILYKKGKVNKFCIIRSDVDKVRIKCKNCNKTNFFHHVKYGQLIMKALSDGKFFFFDYKSCTFEC